MSRRVPAPPAPIAPIALPALVALALVVALLALTAASPAIAGASQQGTQTPANVTLPPEETVVEVQLEPDGDAYWEVRERFVLTDPVERSAFDEQGEAFEARTAGSLGLRTFREAAQQATERADREMSITNESYAVEREEGSFENVAYLNGTYSLSFRWNDFARVLEADEDSDLVTYAVDDAFNATSGSWFPGLTGDQRLVIRLPDRTTPIDTPTNVQDQAMRWSGPTDFTENELAIVYQTQTSGGGPTSALVWAALAITAIALLLAALLLARRRGYEPSAVIGALGSGEDEASSGAGAAGPAADESADGETDADEEADDDEDLELLSDEERVEHLIDDNGGRMKQANIVKETGWSNAKVSQLLSSMEEEGRITKLRIGRENLIAFPEEDVGEFES